VRRAYAAVLSLVLSAPVWAQDPPKPVPPTPVPTRIVATPPSAPNRFGHIEVQGDYDSMTLFVFPPGASDYAATDAKGSYVIVADPGVTVTVLVTTLKDRTLGQAMAQVVFPGIPKPPPDPVPPVPPGPGPGPTPDPTPTPDPMDPDIVILGAYGAPVSKVAEATGGVQVVPASVPLLASYVFDRDTSTFAQISLQTDAQLMQTLKSQNASQRNYDAPRTQTELIRYGFDDPSNPSNSLVRKYGVPCVFWQKIGTVEVIAVTKNPTREKMEKTLKLIRGSR